ncbi:MAG: GxxExxY protein [Bacteroidetes bacterium]|nr:GxxExxY protein [Bacteroidota bacterium]
MSLVTKKLLDELTYEIVGSAIEVHKELGPGLLESIYHKCLKKELSLRGIDFKSEFSVPLLYKSEPLETDLRCDLLIENQIVVELKAVETMLPIFEAQLLTYMKLLEVPKGILINFNVKNIFHEGQKTFVNDYFKLLS